MVVTDVFITGKWQGAYRYGKGYSAAVQQLSIAFEVELTCTEGLLHGRCIDFGKGRAAKRKGFIEGYIQGDLIYFTKKYRHAWGILGNGRMVPFKGTPSRNVHYTGYFRGDQYKGEWQIFSLVVNDTGLQEEKVMEGIWYMQKLPHAAAGNTPNSLPYLQRLRLWLVNMFGKSK